MANRIPWLGIVGLLIAGCWADFPDSRMNQDSSPGGDQLSTDQRSDQLLVPDGPMPCIDSSTCGGYACNKSTGVCLKACNQSSHCAKDFICNPAHVCVMAVPCSSDAPCGGYDCNKGTCRVMCERESHCADNFLCSANETCIPEVSCSSDAQCSGYECDNGTCRVSCQWSGHCAKTHRCQGGACVPKS